MLTAVSRHCHSSCCVCCTLCRSSNRRSSSSRECRSHVAAPLQEVSCPLQNNSEPQGRPASAKLKSSTAALDLPNKVSVPATPAGVASGIAAAGSAAKHCSSRLLKQSLNVSHHCRRREQRRSSRECCKALEQQTCQAKPQCLPPLQESRAASQQQGAPPRQQGIPQQEPQPQPPIPSAPEPPPQQEPCQAAGVGPARRLAAAPAPALWQVG